MITLNPQSIKFESEGLTRVFLWSTVVGFDINENKDEITLKINDIDSSRPVIGIQSVDGYDTIADVVAAIESYLSSTVAYREYTATLTQEFVSTTSGDLEIGKTYVIDTLETGDDFDNTGYVEEGTPFVAIAETPTVWTESTVVINMTDSAPVPTVFRNSLGTPIFERIEEGVNTATLAGVFTEGDVFFPNDYIVFDGGFATLERTDDDTITISTFDGDGLPADDLLLNTPIEIRVK